MLRANRSRLPIADCRLPITRQAGPSSLPAAVADCSTGFNSQSEIRNPKSRGLSLIEVVASTMIVGLLAVATLQALGAATRSSISIGNRAVALGLADDLMAEILQAAYSNPDGPNVFGPEPDEVGGPRALFDDVDDYHGWSESPPQHTDGTPIADRADWRRWVEVHYVAPGNPQTVTASDQGVKRIRVTVEYRGQVLAEQVAVRTNLD